MKAFLGVAQEIARAPPYDVETVVAIRLQHRFERQGSGLSLVDGEVDDAEGGLQRSQLVEQVDGHRFVIDTPLQLDHQTQSDA